MIGLLLTVATVTSISTAAAQAVPRDPVIAGYGACLVRQGPDRARRLLATEIGSELERARARSIAQGLSSCIGPRRVLSMQTGEVRGTVAAALLQQDLAALAQLRARPSRPPSRAQPAEGRAFIAGFARCIADAKPAEATAVIMTPPGSAAEREAILALGDTLVACMPHGIEYRLDRFDLRNHMAAHLYLAAYPPETS